MYASKPTPAPIVKGNSFGNFNCSRNRYEIDRMNMVLYASAIGSLMSVQVQVRTYPDVAHESEMFWQKSSPDIDHWNGVKNVLQFLQSIIGLMLSKKEQVLSNSGGYKC